MLFARVANKIRQVCCAGADGVLGNDDDPWTEQVERNTVSGAGGTAARNTRGITWYMPDTCEKEFASAEAFEEEVMQDDKVWAVVFHSAKKGQHPQSGAR